MKTQFKMFLALVGCGFSAAFHRNSPDVVALGNDAPKPGEDPGHPGQQAPQVDLAKENTELKQKVAKLEAATPKNEKAVREKMAAGLSREQAEAAVGHQTAFTKRFAQRGEKK